MQYNFEWDPVKARSNRAKHGVGFEEAATVFHDPGMLILCDHEHSADENRWITLGISAKGRVVVVCHAYREETSDSVAIRIFSSRKATQHESRQYQR